MTCRLWHFVLGGQSTLAWDAGSLGHKDITKVFHVSSSATHSWSLLPAVAACSCKLHVLTGRWLLCGVLCGAMVTGLALCKDSLTVGSR